MPTRHFRHASFEHLPGLFAPRNGAAVTQAVAAAMAQRRARAGIYTDDALEHWGEFFVANNLHARGVLFETFMQYPREIAEALVWKRAMPLPPGQDHYPLLPAQRRLVQKINYPSPPDGGRGQGEGDE